MKLIYTTQAFDLWFGSLKDKLAARRIQARIDRAEEGNFGDHKAVGEGVYEMREHFGPGWRMYYIQRGSVLIVMLGGGDKSTQTADIAKAVKLAAMIEE